MIAKIRVARIGVTPAEAVMIAVEVSVGIVVAVAAEIVAVKARARDEGISEEEVTVVAAEAVMIDGVEVTAAVAGVVTTFEEEIAGSVRQRISRPRGSRHRLSLPS